MKNKTTTSLLMGLLAVSLAASPVTLLRSRRLQILKMRSRKISRN